jgi:hypothetical protein
MDLFVPLEILVNISEQDNKFGLFVNNHLKDFIFNIVIRTEFQVTNEMTWNRSIRHYDLKNNL